MKCPSRSKENILIPWMIEMVHLPGWNLEKVRGVAAESRRKGVTMANLPEWLKAQEAR